MNRPITQGYRNLTVVSRDELLNEVWGEDTYPTT